MKTLPLSFVAAGCLAWNATAQECTGWFDADPQSKPIPVYMHAAAYDSQRQRLVVTGGSDGSGNGTPGNWVWDGVDWTQLETYPTTQKLAMVFDSRRGVVIAAGGFENEYEYEPYESVFELNGSVWTHARALPVALGGLAMAFDSARGVTVLFGGKWVNGKLQQKTYEYDGQAWTLVSDTGPSPRQDHCMAYDIDRKVVVMHGGYPGKNDTWEWDGTAWTLKGTGPSLSGASMAYDEARHRTVLFGGSYSDDLWEWDGAKWTWRTAPGPGGRLFGAMAYDSANAQVILSSGVSKLGIRNDIWSWDGSSWHLLYERRFNGRIDASMTYDAVRRQVILFGGGDYSGSGHRETWRWNGKDWQLLNVGPEAPEGFNPPLSYDARRGVVVAHGGAIDSDTDAHTYEWNGEHWSLASDAGPARQAHGLAFDEARGVTVLFGGYYQRYDDDEEEFVRYGDTWTWDGSEWHEVAVDGPGPRSGCAMAYDPNRSVIVLHGGYADQGVLSDTWEWNGQSWMLVSIDGPVRSGATMTYVGNLNAMVLYGGADQNHDPTSATWTWNGGEWTRRDDLADAQARIGHAMAYDPWRKALVLHGGYGWVYPQVLRSTYELSCGAPCYPDFDADGDLTLFDFLAFVNAFNASDPAADCDASNSFDLFDFLCFTNAFNAGC